VIKSRVHDHQGLIPSCERSLLNIVEVFYDTLTNFMRDVIGEGYKNHVFFVGTLAMFILSSNIFDF
jgi:F0F1-type ATP synthase membrane subunit a